MKRLIFSFTIIVLLGSCTKKKEETVIKEGYKPVYISKEQAFKVKAEPPSVFGEPGKMFLYQNVIFVTDFGSGVHVIDNSDPSHPKKVAFISIPGVVDAAVKNGVLFADNFTDLVAFDVSNPVDIKFKKRIKNVYPLNKQMYPEFATGYFECVDTTKGYVLRWEKATLENPKCYR